MHEAERVNAFLKKKNPYNYIYQLSNLAPEIWEQVICYGIFEEEELKEIAMVNMNYGIPVLLAASFENAEWGRTLVEGIKEFLPKKFYTHIDKGTIESVFSDCHISDLEEYMNMGFEDTGVLEEIAVGDAVRLDELDLKAIKELIEESYPEAWLDDELVKLKENFGVFVDGRLVSFSGIHAYSEEYGVAAVAHVTTLLEYRKKGYGGNVTGALVKSLHRKISHIGLNVRAFNNPAIYCYKKIGFLEQGHFVACEIDMGNRK